MVMAKLNFSLDGKSLGEFALDKERITIGRRPSNDIHIDNLAVSGEHAMILTLGNDSFLEDLNSTNGTLVNKKLIKKHVLQHGDVIEFGKYQLKYVSENQEKNAHSDGFEKTMLIKKPANLDENVAEPLAVSESGPVLAEVMVDPTPKLEPEPDQEVQVSSSFTSENTQTIGRLQVLNGNNSGHELLLNRTMVKLGKPGAQLAVITKRPHGYYITHIEGEAHPFVNGQSIGVQAHALNDHDVIELSGTKMEFYLA